MTTKHRNTVVAVPALRHTYLSTAEVADMVANTPAQYELPVVTAGETQLRSFTWLLCEDGDRWFLANRLTGTLFDWTTGAVASGTGGGPRIVGGLPRPPERCEMVYLDGVTTGEEV